MGTLRPVLSHYLGCIRFLHKNQSRYFGPGISFLIS
jgi:hypothetical protein